MLACDGSLEGVLAATGVTYLAHVHEGEARLALTKGLQPRLGEAVVRVPADTHDETVSFARRVLEGFGRRVTHGCRRVRDGRCPSTCDGDCVRRLVFVTASDEPGMPEIAYRYLRLGFAEGPRVRTLISDSRVAAFHDLARSVLGECEHTRQFVRFSHMADGSFVASFSPKANTIPLTASHFAARMGTERFCLVDPRHRIAAFHEAGQRGCELVRLDAALAADIATRTDFADDEPYVRAMWQRFYVGTTTPGRDRSQRGYDLRTKWMPQRLWQGLVELGEERGVSVPARYAGTTTLQEPDGGPRCLEPGGSSDPA